MTDGYGNDYYDYYDAQQEAYDRYVEEHLRAQYEQYCLEQEAMQREEEMPEKDNEA